MEGFGYNDISKLSELLGSVVFGDLHRKNKSMEKWEKTTAEM